MLETNINNLDAMDKNPVLGIHVRRRNIIAKLQRLEQRALRVEVRRFLQRDVEYSALQVRLKEVKHRVHVLRCGISKKVFGLSKRRTAIMNMQKELRTARRAEARQTLQLEKVMSQIEVVDAEALRIGLLRLGVSVPEVSNTPVRSDSNLPC